MHSFCVYNQSLTTWGVYSLAQWLEHWISDQEVLGFTAFCRKKIQTLV